MLSFFLLSFRFSDWNSSCVFQSTVHATCLLHLSIFNVHFKIGCQMQVTLFIRIDVLLYPSTSVLLANVLSTFEVVIMRYQIVSEGLIQNKTAIKYTTAFPFAFILFWKQQVGPCSDFVWINGRTGSTLFWRIALLWDVTLRHPVIVIRRLKGT
jgi:hypothetical protein